MLNPQDDSDPLAGLYADEEEEDDPLAGLYADEEEAPEVPRDVVKEVQQEAGIEEDPFDTSDIERAAELGTAEATRGLISGATLGISEHVPGLKTGENIAASTGELFGSLLPLEFLITTVGKPLVNVAKKSPVFNRSLQALAGLTGIGLAGGVYGGTKQAIEKGEIPSVNEVLEHGFDWVLLDGALKLVGGTTKFATELLKQSKKIGKPEYKVLNDVYTELRKQGIDVGKDKRAGTKALSILEDMGKEVPKGETRKVTEKQFKTMDDSLDSLAEPILPEAPLENVNVNSMVESAEEQAVRNKIDSVGRRAVEDSELGREVQEGINRSREEAKNQYRPFYDEVEEASRFISTNPAQTARTSGDLIQLLEEIRTRPKGYSTVIDTIESVLRDAGYVIQRNEAGVIDNIIQQSEVPLNRLIELGRRLNEVVDYDVLDRTVKDRLRPVVRAVKSDIRTALQRADPDLLEAFNLAEESYALNAERFGRDSIRKIRGTEALEKIPKQIESATALQDLRPILSPQAMQNVERDILEKINKMSEAKAQDFLRKVRSGLSRESQEIADEIIRSKRPINKQSIQTRRERLHETIDNDLVQAMNTGQRPDKTLKLWQNPRGQKLVREALETNPQRAELLDYLQKQTLQDMAKSIISKDGTIELEKLKQLMENPALRSNLRDLGGQEAVDFFEQLYQRTQNLKKNAQQLVTEKLGTQKGMKLTKEVSSGEKGKQILKRMAAKDYPLAGKIQAALDALDFSGKISLNLFTLIKFGFLKGAMIPIGTRILQKMVTSNKVRRAFIEASKKHTDPLLFLAAIENLGNAIDEEE